MTYLMAIFSFLKTGALWCFDKLKALFALVVGLFKTTPTPPAP